MQNCPKPKYHLLLYYTNIHSTNVHCRYILLYRHRALPLLFCILQHVHGMVHILTSNIHMICKKTTKKNLIKFVLLWKVHACYMYKYTIRICKTRVVLHKRERVFIIWFYGHLEKLCTCVRHGWNSDVTIKFILEKNLYDCNWL